MIDDAKIKRIRDLANGATKAPWTRYDCSQDTEARVVGDGWVVAQCASRGEGQVQKDADYIASVDPSTVHDLLDEIERLRAKCEERKKMLAQHERCADAMVGQGPAYCEECGAKRGKDHGPDCAWKRAMEDV